MQFVIRNCIKIKNNIYCKYRGSGIHDTKEKTCRHLNFFEHKTYIHCKVPRTRCYAHKVLLIAVPWLIVKQVLLCYLKN